MQVKSPLSALNLHLQSLVGVDLGGLLLHGFLSCRMSHRFFGRVVSV